MVPLFSSSFDLTCLMDGDKISVLGLKSLTSQPKAYKSNSDHHYSRLKSFSNPTYSTKLDSLPHFLSQINFRFFLFFWGGGKNFGNFNDCCSLSFVTLDVDMRECLKLIACDDVFYSILQWVSWVIFFLCHWKLLSEPSS